MRVVQIVPALDRGGAEAIAASLAGGLSRRGHESALVSLYPIDPSSATRQQLAEDGVTIVSLGKRSGPSPATVWRLRSWISAFTPALAHTHVGGLIYGFPAMYLTAIPIVHTVHNDPRYEVPRSIRSIHSLAYRSGVRGVVLSDSFLQGFRDMYGRDPVAVVPNGIDLVRHGSALQTSRDRGADDAFHVVVVGRLEEQKRIDVLLAAAAELPAFTRRSIEVRILGSGKLRPYLEARAAALGITDKVEFLGRVDDVEPYLDWADVVALSSDYEGMPVSVVEAMAHGLPVVATRVGAVPDLVLDGRTGFLVPCGDARSLAARLADLADDHALCRALGDAGRDRSTIFDTEAMIDRYEALYVGIGHDDA